MDSLDFNDSVQFMESQLLIQLPILHVKGTNFTIGYTIGRTFKNLIHDFLKKADFVEKVWAAYETKEGREIYESSLRLCREKYALYVEELEGMAKGSELPFHQLFLLHIDSLIIPRKQSKEFQELKGSGENGCSDLMTFDSKRNLVLLGHTEDQCPGMKNDLFIVVAQVFDKTGTTMLEHFASVTCAGYLPGATMGFNYHGVYHTNNTLVPNQTHPGKTPIFFMNREFLGATDPDHVLRLIQDNPIGTADGFNLNLAYVPRNSNDTPIVQSIEVAPNNEGPESAYDIQTVKDESSYAHCNKYLRMKVLEPLGITKSSEHRLEVIEKHTKNVPVYDLETMKLILSDQSNSEYPIYRDGKGKCGGVTGLVGIFDILNRKWYLYKDRPVNSSPIAVISLDLV